MTITVLIPSEAGRHAGALLSARELSYVERFRSASRRHGATAARVAAKWALLRQLQPASVGEDDPSLLHWLGAGCLESADASRFREVEVLPPDGRPGTAPRLSCRGRLLACGYHVSMAHTHGLAGAMVGRSGPVGLDIEDAAADAPARALWTVKEALLKTGLTGARTLWELLDLDVAPVVVPPADEGGTSRYLAVGPALRKGVGVLVTLTRCGGLLICGAVAAGPPRASPPYASCGGSPPYRTENRISLLPLNPSSQGHQP